MVMNLVNGAIHHNKKGGHTMKVSIDRFEGDYAVVELPDMSTVDMSKQLLPKGAKEGDVLSISIDIDETKNRKKKVEKLMDELWE